MLLDTDKFEPGDLDDYSGNNQSLIETFSSISDIVHILDPFKPKALYANVSLSKALGYSKKEVDELGEGWVRILVHPDDFHFVTKHIQNFSKMKPNSRSRVVFRMKNKSGEWTKFECVSTPLCAKNNNRKKCYVLSITKKVASTPEINIDESGDHRCLNCQKLLGKSQGYSEIEIKCARCGEFNNILNSK